MTAEVIALTLAGIISPFATKYSKQIFGDPEGGQALLIAYVISFALGVIAIFATGGFVECPPVLSSAIQWIVLKLCAVSGIAQLVYQAIRLKTSNI